MATTILGLLLAGCSRNTQPEVQAKIWEIVRDGKVVQRPEAGLSESLRTSGVTWVLRVHHLTPWSNVLDVANVMFASGADGVVIHLREAPDDAILGYLDRHALEEPNN